MSDSELLVFVHLPKTAGLSFAGLLRNEFGHARVHPDFGDHPMNTPTLVRRRHAMRKSLEIARGPGPDADCVHGHFLPLKYLLLSTRRPVRFVTWLRHPAERLRSNYRFWRRTYDQTEETPTLKRRVCSENWSFEEFCLSPEMRDMYSEFLWGFPLSYFDFVGITEHFAEDLSYFGRRFLHRDITVSEHLNSSPADDSDAPLDESLRARIEDFHSRDMQLYRAALAARESRPTH